MHFDVDIYTIRDITYIGFDLQIADVPWKFDFTDKKGLEIFLGNRVKNYKNKESLINMMNSMSSLLNNVVYTSNEESIIEQNIAKRIMRSLDKIDYNNIKYYEDLFIFEESVFNKNYYRRNDFDINNIASIKFKSEEEDIAIKLYQKLNSMEFVRAAWNRYPKGGTAVVFALGNNCDRKVKTSFRVLQECIKLFIDNIKIWDSKYITASKFFLYYLFNENYVNIKGTLDENKCVTAVLGNAKRIKILDEIIAGNKNKADDNTKHEIEYMRDILKEDNIRDTAIVIPSSIIIDNGKEHICECDGMVIFINRDKLQILMPEAKNGHKKCNDNNGKHCLKERLKKLDFKFDSKDIVSPENKDAYIKMTVSDNNVYSENFSE